MAGVAFTGCSPLDAAGAGAATSTRAAGATSTRRREVVVNGRRMKTVDVHAHCVIPETLVMTGLKPETQRRGLVMVIADRVREMDEQGICSWGWGSGALRSGHVGRGGTAENGCSVNWAFVPPMLPNTRSGRKHSRVVNIEIKRCAV